MNCGHVIRKSGRYSADNVAVWFDGASMTYGQLYERSCRLVNVLLDLGIAPQDRVATLGPNNMWSLEEIAGLALGGFVRIPLHYRNTVDLHLFMISHVGARTLVVDEPRYRELADRLDEVPSLELVLVHGLADAGGGTGDGDRRRVRVLDYERLLRTVRPDDPEIVVHPDDMLHMAFTSGTTGRPKATVQTHRSWLNVTAENMIMLRPITGDDRYLAAGPLSHAASTIIFALLAKAAGNVVMASFEPRRAAELIEQYRATITVLVPTMIQMLVSEPSTADRDLSSLQAVLATGAPITERTIREAQGVLGDVLYLGFGQSEGIPATILTPAEIRSGLAADPSLLRSAGRCTPRSMVKILDEDGNECPPGQQGEIAIDTPGNMKEIWGDPEATASRFTSEGFILTRDIGYLDERGYLFLADRKEDMIISGGFNIWPAEVENAVAAHPAVLEVAVVGVPHPKWGETPRAVVVLRAGRTATEDEIVQWCRDRIGSMKKPTSVAFRTQPLPKSPVGKLLRRVVREQEWPADAGSMIGGA
ncbi:class I adenylate-forming enzyme family protein [Frankia sp. QA3]|uniref:class I adenylate-forming enzyme family protein n=1 Tax=Frankia sp. QA3 TaxID=710111 RepID=UPI000269BF7C|nr:AMP-binding protein [Frankia sp. QA3]EIV92861.1 acyl-CoA synthetase (AMP-forming)/AMP-acid ligase II [Frankia sp. QA3]